VRLLLLSRRGSTESRRRRAALHSRALVVADSEGRLWGPAGGRAPRPFFLRSEEDLDALPPQGTPMPVHYEECDSVALRLGNGLAHNLQLLRGVLRRQAQRPHPGLRPQLQAAFDEALDGPRLKGVSGGSRGYYARERPRGSDLFAHVAQRVRCWQAPGCHRLQQEDASPASRRRTHTGRCQSPCTGWVPAVPARAAQALP